MPRRGWKSNAHELDFAGLEIARLPSAAGTTLKAPMFGKIGAALAIVRQERGLSQDKLAYLCRIGRPQVSKYEAGKELMKLETLEKLLTVLHVEPIDFFRLMSSLNAIPASPHETADKAECDQIFETCRTLHSAIDLLQQTMERRLAPRTITALGRERETVASQPPAEAANPPPSAVPPTARSARPRTPCGG